MPKAAGRLCSGGSTLTQQPPAHLRRAKNLAQDHEALGAFEIERRYEDQTLTMYANENYSGPGNTGRGACRYTSAGRKG